MEAASAETLYFTCPRAFPKRENTVICGFRGGRKGVLFETSYNKNNLEKHCRHAQYVVFAVEPSKSIGLAAVAGHFSQPNRGFSMVGAVKTRIYESKVARESSKRRGLVFYVVLPSKFVQNIGLAAF